MRRIIIITVFTMLLLIGITNADTYPLVSGRHLEVVGSVNVDSDKDNLYITYNPDGLMFESHLEIVAELGDIPQRKGNPIPGRFTYSRTYPSGVNSDMYVIPTFGIVNGVRLYIAAHAVVSKVSYVVDMLELYKSPQGLVTAKPVPSVCSYFGAAVMGSGLDDIYEGYCIDSMSEIVVGITYDATITSVYTSNISRLAGPLTYIVNNFYPGMVMHGGNTLTVTDIQIAIWKLLGDSIPEVYLDGSHPWSESNVREILYSARCKWRYIPDIGGVTLAIVYPVGAQPFIIMIPVPYRKVIGCHRESAWAGLNSFSGKNWATYIIYE